jgi:ABC-type branched-subunit amino acid transport system substrate-binding protein
MRSIQDKIFLGALVLALVVSTSVAVLAAASASAPVTIQVKGGGYYSDGTAATGTGTPGSGSQPGAGQGGPGSSQGGGGGGNTQGVTGDTITVGGIFTKTNGIDATVEQDTMQACFDMVNAQGGVSGHKLQLASYDDGMDPTRAAQEAAKLDQQDHFFAIVGWLAPFGEASAAPYFESHGVPIIGGLGVPQEFNNPWSFPITPVFSTDGYALGNFATKSSGPLHFHHPAVFLVRTAGIDDVANGIKRGAAANGVTVNNSDIVQVDFGTPTNAYEPYLLQFQQEGVDGLITQLDPFSYVRLYQAEQSTGKTFPHLAGVGIDKQNVDQQIDRTGSQLVNTYSFMPVLEARGNPARNAEVNLYNNTVARYFPGQVPNMDAFAEGSWVACRIFLQALGKLGSNITRAGLKQALESGAYDVGGMGPALNWGSAGPSHAANHYGSFIVYTSQHAWAEATGFIRYS